MSSREVLNIQSSWWNNQGHILSVTLDVMVNCDYVSSNDDAIRDEIQIDIAISENEIRY